MSYQEQAEAITRRVETLAARCEKLANENKALRKEPAEEAETEAEGVVVNVGFIDWKALFPEWPRVYAKEESCPPEVMPDPCRTVRWFSVSEDLPSEEGIYLVFAPTVDNGWRDIHMADYTYVNGWMLLLAYWTNPITHWMPLPKPPEEMP